MEKMDDKGFLEQVAKSLSSIRMWIGAIFLGAFVMRPGIDACQKTTVAAVEAESEREEFPKCMRPLRALFYYADPITKVCGLRLDGAVLQGSHESCPAILALPAFEKIRHCWGAPK